MSQVKKTFEEFLTSLKTGRYVSEISARRTLGHFQVTDEQKTQGLEEIKKYFSENDHSKSEVEVFRAHYQQVHEATGVSWTEIGKVIGLSHQTLKRLNKGETKFSPETLEFLRKGLRKYPLTSRDVPAKKSVKVKASVIEEVKTLGTSGLPSMIELDMRELDIIQRLRTYHLTGGAPKGTNGKHHY